ncbi:hypothetical protein [Winogradskya humida]|uniref:Uncharacterized protein n=1 Tax=Winogradskya humida TaxID=113566 RepID=A0ABQ4A1A7_9ACTN|nr:hypothetical protein [Actinoplanes humidus]GIE24640.1 hypothetical protein Ahu01nite_077420 [Actinoplanes humidus]
MELRAELCEPEIAPERLAEVCAAVERIEELHWRGEPTEAAIAAFNADTGYDLDLYAFLSYSSSGPVEEFARGLLWPAWPKVPDITRDELIEIVGRALTNPFYLHVLEVNVTHPAPVLRDDATPEEIVDEILSYRPFAL